MSDNFQSVIKLFQKHNAVMKSSQLFKLGVQPRILYAMRDNGLVLQVGRGLYRLANEQVWSDPDLAVVSLLIPKGVICLISALYFHQITTQIPHQVYVALPKDSEKPRIKYPPTRFFWISPEPFQAGIEKHKIDNVSIQVYSVAKTIADSFKFRNSIGMDVALEALREGLRQRKTGLLAFLMQRLGLSPNFIGGGRVKQFMTEKNPRNYATGVSEHLVIEACESDGTIVNYEPQCTIILNLDLDHHPVEETARMFEALAAKTSGTVHINADDRDLVSCDIKDALTFSIDNVSGCRAEEISYDAFRTFFRVHGQEFQLSLPGRHNLYNALSCISVLSVLGISLKEIAGALPEFSGIERRFDIHLNDDRRLVIDDYAHNPHKIWSMMQTMQQIRAAQWSRRQPPRS